jgi:hypothetical protein
MRPVIRIAIEDDPARKDKLRIVLHASGVERLECFAENLTPQEASRMHVALRKAFLAGIHWMREDASSYTLSVHPDVICTTRNA